MRVKLLELESTVRSPSAMPAASAAAEGASAGVQGRNTPGIPRRDERHIGRSARVALVKLQGDAGYKKFPNKKQAPTCAHPTRKT